MKYVFDRGRREIVRKPEPELQIIFALEPPTVDLVVFAELERKLREEIYRVFSLADYHRKCQRWAAPRLDAAWL
jgi:hypothetical protein